MIYQIMNKDNVLAEFETLNSKYGVSMRYTKLEELPFKLTNLEEFIKSRTVLVDRYGWREQLARVGIHNQIDLISLTYGVSLTDTFWIKRKGDNVTWEVVNPYTGKVQFDYSWFITETGNKQVFKGIPDYATDGNFPKCWIEVDGCKWLAKCGRSGAYNAGIEPLSEILFTQISDALGFYNTVKYSRVDIDYRKVSASYRIPGLVKETVDIKEGERLASVCKCFTSEQSGLVTARELGLSSYKDVIQFAKEHCSNWKDICYILLTDAIGLNEDRHLGNIGFEFNTDTFEITKVAPMYDNNLSLLCYYEDRLDLKEYLEVLRAKDGQDFVSLAKEMLSIIPEAKDKLIKMRDNFRFVTDFYINPKRIDMLNDVTRSQIENILKH